MSIRLRARKPAGPGSLTRVPGLVRAVVIALVASTLGLLGVALLAPPAQAAGTPDLQLSGARRPQCSTAARSRSTSPPPSRPGARRSWQPRLPVVLPARTRYVAGSAGNDAKPTILTNAPTSGKTTLIWPNVDDPSPAHRTLRLPGRLQRHRVARHAPLRRG